ncbi:MAG: hypothetical protein Q8M22_12565 [Actinomycetota bacterium]|nr:hypothetical protein [Actinomycetota bacterium]
MFRRGAVALVLSTLVLTGCFTGKRPYFNDDPFPAGAPTGYAEADAVLAKLDAVTPGPVTAAYSVLTKFGNTTSQAVAVLDSGSRSVTIGNVRYVQTPTESVTCTEDGSVPCTEGLDAARVSDIGITIDFYAAEAATRLRRDARAAIAPPTASSLNVAEQVATCVSVPLAGGVAMYCALDDGMLAKLDDGDVAINLTLYGALADNSRLQIPAASAP